MGGGRSTGEASKKLVTEVLGDVCTMLSLRPLLAGQKLLAVFFFFFFFFFFFKFSVALCSQRP